jgi:hypothetical protein
VYLLRSFVVWIPVCPGPLVGPSLGSWPIPTRQGLSPGPSARAPHLLFVDAVGFGEPALVFVLAPTARHALYLLYVLAVSVLTLEAKINPAFVAAVGGSLSVGDGCARCAKILSSTVGFLSVGRVPGCCYTRGTISLCAPILA